MSEPDNPEPMYRLIAVPRDSDAPALRAAVLAEREACAKIADGWLTGSRDADYVARSIAQEIRERP